MGNKIVSIMTSQPSQNIITRAIGDPKKIVTAQTINKYISNIPDPSTKNSNKCNPDIQTIKQSITNTQNIPNTQLIIGLQAVTKIAKYVCPSTMALNTMHKRGEKKNTQHLFSTEYPTITIDMNGDIEQSVMTEMQRNLFLKTNKEKYCSSTKCRILGNNGIISIFCGANDIYYGKRTVVNYSKGTNIIAPRIMELTDINFNHHIRGNCAFVIDNKEFFDLLLDYINHNIDYCY